jgi:N-dimethylarginine dimethylaminohydrolase
MVNILTIMVGNYKNMKVNVSNEFEKLQSVVIGRYKGFHRNSNFIEIINNTQKKTFQTSEKPTRKTLEPEFEKFISVLKKHKVKIIVPELCKDKEIQDQLTPRDIGFFINNIFFVSSMANYSRKKEWTGIYNKLIKKLNPKKVIYVPKNVCIEGGDVILGRNNIVYIGHSLDRNIRTNEQGIEFIKEIIRIHKMKWKVEVVLFKKGLHLDCVFNPLGKNNALIYRSAIVDAPQSLYKNYNHIQITKKDFNNLGTNVLSISKKIIISRDININTNRKLKKYGYKVIKLPFNECAKSGGLFRCATLPVLRGEK